MGTFLSGPRGHSQPRLAHVAHIGLVRTCRRACRCTGRTGIACRRQTHSKFGHQSARALGRDLVRLQIVLEGVAQGVAVEFEGERLHAAQRTKGKSASARAALRMKALH